MPFPVLVQPVRSVVLVQPVRSVVLVQPVRSQRLPFAQFDTSVDGVHFNIAPSATDRA